MKKSIFLYLILIGFFISQTGSVFAEEDADDKVFDLGTVVVTAKGGDVDTVTTVTSITMEDIEKSGAQNVSQALELVPGVDIQMGSKGQAGLKLRGVDQKDVKVLIDGIPAQETYEGSLDLGQISVESVARIDITKGAASVMYGANSLGGVINIITKKGSGEPETKVAVELGQNATSKLSVNHGAAIGKWNYWVTASRESSDGYTLSQSFDPNNTIDGLGTDYNEDGGIRDLSYYTKNTLSAKIGYEADEDTKAYLTFDYHSNVHGCPTFNDTYWEFNKWDQWHLNFVGEHAFSDFLSMKTRLYFVDHDDTLEDVGGWDSSHTTSAKWFEQSAYEDNTTGMELQAFMDFGDISLLKVGFIYQADVHKQTDYYDAAAIKYINDTRIKKGKAPLTLSEGWQPSETYKANTVSLAIEDEIIVSDNLLVTAGFSSDSYTPIPTATQGTSYTTSSVNPQVGMTYDLSEATNIHASVSQKTRFPQLKELYSNMGGGNPNLKPQEGTAIEIGATTELNEDINTSISIFNSQITNKIDRVTVSGNKIYVNIGKSAITGIELDVDYDVTEQFNTGISYINIDAKDKADDTVDFVTALYTPRSKLVIDLTYNFGMGMNLNFQTIYTGEQVCEDTNDNRVTLDPFILGNLKFSKDLENLIGFNSAAYIEIDNITDLNYHEYSGPQPGRSILIGMNMTF